MTDVVAEHGALTFTMQRDGSHLGQVRLPLRGVHMARNAAGAVAMADLLGVPFDAAVSALARFGEIGRASCRERV